MNSAFDPVTIVFLLLAVFVIYRLRSVLGQRTGNEPTRQNRDRPADNGNVIPLSPAVEPRAAAADATPSPDRWKGIAELGTPLAAGLDAVAGADPGFDPKGFLQGAKAAYEMIVLAFARGDRKALRDLLSKEVFDGFVSAIAEREQRGETVESTFVSIDKAEVTDAAMKGRNAMLTVRFVSKIITATKDSSGAVIDGALDKVSDVTDIWTFSHDTGSRDPNWRLVATEAGQ
jgi:predicted lipid-binding transport protein (Tim44 family)